MCLAGQSYNYNTLLFTPSQGENERLQSEWLEAKHALGREAERGAEASREAAAKLEALSERKAQVEAALV